MNIIRLLIILPLFAFNLLTATVENSIISTMEKFESIENLPSQKFTQNQFREIESALEKKDEKIRLVSYNMLFNLYDHNLNEENRWPERLPRIVELMDAMSPDIISTQELYPDQVKDITEALDKDFAFFAGQKDADGESYGIFYRKERFEILNSEINYPLSHIQLKDIKTDKIVHIFNTHMPLSNIEKREANAHIIAEMIEPYAKNEAVLFTGDLNVFPTRLDMTGLPFYDGDYIHRILSQGSLKNAIQVSLLGHFGPISTFTNQDPETTPFQGTGTPGIILDYIYVSSQVRILTHGVEKATVNGHFPSDHMPVLVDFLILQ